VTDESFIDSKPKMKRFGIPLGCYSHDVGLFHFFFSDELSLMLRASGTRPMTADTDVVE
jgi:hypothetical protein